MNEQSYGDMSQVDENAVGGSALVPDGTYPVYIADYKFKPTRVGTPNQGLQLVLTMMVAEGAHANEKVVDGFNIRNNNADTVRIALQQLKGLTTACNLNGNQPLTETLMRQWFQNLVYVELGTQPANGQYGPKNKVKKFIHPNEVGESGAATTAPSAPSAPMPNAQPDESVDWAQQANAAGPQAPVAPQAPSAPTAA